MGWQGFTFEKNLMLRRANNVQILFRIRISSRSCIRTRVSEHAPLRLINLYRLLNSQSVNAEQAHANH